MGRKVGWVDMMINYNDMVLTFLSSAEYKICSIYYKFRSRRVSTARFIDNRTIQYTEHELQDRENRYKQDRENRSKRIKRT